MASAKSNYLETKVADHVLSKGVRTFTSPAALYVSLHTADPGEDGTNAEITGLSGYARLAVTFSAAAAGITKNSNILTFTASENWGTITHIAIWDALTAGNCLYYGALTVSKVVSSGDSLVFNVNMLAVGEL